MPFGKSRSILLGLTIMGTLITGCVSARVEESEPGVGGVITLVPAQNPEAKEKAKMLMQENCGEKKAQVTKEGYVVVGSSTNGNQETAPSTSHDMFSGKKTAALSTSSSSTTNQVKEWRLNYKCI